MTAATPLAIRALSVITDIAVVCVVAIVTITVLGRFTAWGVGHIRRAWREAMLDHEL